MNRNTRSTLLSIGGFVVFIAIMILTESTACSAGSSSNFVSKEDELRSEYEYELKNAVEEARSEAYAEGHSLGVEEGTKQGYSVGYDEGYTEAYSSGYIYGFEDAREQIIRCLQDPILHDYGFDVADYIDITPKY